MSKIDWQRWLMAIYYDLTHQEDKQQLTRKEKIYYSGYAAVIFFAIGALSFLIPSLVLAIISSVLCFAIGARKLTIFWHKKSQWEAENKNYKSDV